MRHTLVVAIVLMLGVTVSTAGASTKFSYTQGVDIETHLVVGFEEGSLKRFDTVDYQLDAFGFLSTPTIAFGSRVTGTVQLVTDERGRVSGDIGTTLNFLALFPCGCTGPRKLEYSDITLTNLTTGHVYRLDPITVEV